MIINGTGIALRNITKRIKDRVLFQDLDFEFQPNAKYALIGPNGSGKTTLLETMLGFVEADAGEVLFDGLPRAQFMRMKSHHVAFQSQFSEFQPFIKVGELVDTFEAMPGFGPGTGPLRAHVRNKLGTALYRALSGGEKKLVSLYLTLISPARLILLDEPTASLDASQAEMVNRLLAEDSRQMIIATNDIGTAIQTAGTILILFNNRLQELPVFHADSILDVFESDANHGAARAAGFSVIEGHGGQRTYFVESGRGGSVGRELGSAPLLKYRYADLLRNLIREGR